LSFSPIVDFPRCCDAHSEATIGYYCQMPMSENLIDDVGEYEHFRSDKFYRMRVVRFALPPRRLRYLKFEQNYQFYILSNMDHLSKRSDNYFESLPEGFKFAFNAFDHGAHLARNYQVRNRINFYPSAREGVELKIMLARFTTEFNEIFGLWCSEINIVRLCLATTWDFIPSDNALPFQ
jgi:hypothetical protein